MRVYKTTFLFRREGTPVAPPGICGFGIRRRSEWESHRSHDPASKQMPRNLTVSLRLDAEDFAKVSWLEYMGTFRLDCYGAADDLYEFMACVLFYPGARYRTRKR